MATDESFVPGVDDGPRLIDGTPFKLGMTVVFDGGRVVRTDDEGFEVERYETSDGRVVYLLGRKEGPLCVDLRRLYPSERALLEHKIRDLEFRREAINIEIDHLRRELLALPQ
jgi:hypothetical protein